MKNIKLEKKTVIDTISRTPIFGYFNNIQKEQILLFADYIEFEKGEKIVTEGESGPYLYVILEGKAQILLQHQDGRSVTLGIMSEGEMFGETAIFTNVKRTASVIATGKVVVMQIERTNLIGFIKANPEAGIKMLMVVVYNLLQRLRDSNEELAFDRGVKMQNAEIETLMNLYNNGK